MRFVLDTNVLFAAFLTHGVCAGLYEDCLLQADLVVSDFILKAHAGIPIVTPRDALALLHTNR